MCLMCTAKGVWEERVRALLSAAVSGLEGGQLQEKHGSVDEQCRAWLSDSSEPHPGTQQEIRLSLPVLHDEKTSDVPRASLPCAVPL